MTDPKAFQTLRARSALLGAELHVSQTDAERWTCYGTCGPITVELPTLADAARWLDCLERLAEGA
jgi:ribulose-5-phosphate 4-epimerase/fuculose-1-phosphate aldolase